MVTMRRSFQLTSIALSALTLAAIGPACGGGTENQPPSPSPSDAGAPPPTTPDATPPPPNGSSNATRLEVRGKDILDPNGTPIVLRGWNWGAWGTWQPEDAAENAKQGANIVRIPLRWWGEYPAGEDSRRDEDPGHIDAAHLKVLDAVIDGIVSQHLWVDLFFDSNCGQGSVEHGTLAACGATADGKPKNFANDPDTRQKFVEVWTFLADRYAKKPFIGMYELLSEPNMGCTNKKNCEDWTSFAKFYGALVPLVRAKDPRTPILVGAGGSYAIDRIDTALLSDAKGIIYTGDILSGASANPDVLAPAIRFRDTANVPIFVQQVGTKKSEPNAAANARQTLGALNAASIGWTWWTYREPRSSTGENFAPFYKGPNDPAWSVDQAWLDLVTGYFRP